MKDDYARGAFGTWARQQRIRHGYKTPDDALAALALLGVKRSASRLRAVEAGLVKPGPRLVSALEYLYGSSWKNHPMAVTLSELLDLLDRETASFNEARPDERLE